MSEVKSACKSAAENLEKELNDLRFENEKLSLENRQILNLNERWTDKVSDLCDQNLSVRFENLELHQRNHQLDIEGRNMSSTNDALVAKFQEWSDENKNFRFKVDTMEKKAKVDQEERLKLEKHVEMLQSTVRLLLKGRGAVEKMSDLEALHICNTVAANNGLSRTYWKWFGFEPLDSVTSIYPSESESLLETI